MPTELESPNYEPCTVQTSAGTWYDQPEYCENEAVPDTGLCAEHLAAWDTWEPPANECPGHPTLNADSMGVTVYCDGSCQ